MRLIDSNILSDTAGIQAVEFGRTLIISTNKDIEYQTVEKAGDIESAEKVTPEDNVYKKVEAFFSGETRVDSVDVVGKAGLVATAEIKAFLDTMIEKNDDFLFVFLDTFNKELVTGLVEWAIANEKFPIYATPTTLPIEEVEGMVETFNSRAIAFDGDDHIEAKAVGFMTTTVPGYLPWSWRRLQGIQKNPRPATEQRKLLNAKVNFANEERRGVYVVVPGKTTSGEFIKNEWGKANMEDDMHIAMVNLLTSNDPVGHPGADLHDASRIYQALYEVIQDYSGSDRKFIATWTDEEIQDGANAQPGDPKAYVKVKTKYTQADIKAGIFSVEWAAMPRGECLEGKIQGLLTFDINKIKGGQASGV